MAAIRKDSGSRWIAFRGIVMGGDQDGFAVTRADCEDIARCKPKVLKKGGAFAGMGLSLAREQGKKKPAPP